MRPKVYYTKSNIDLFIYGIVGLLLLFYAFYIRSTCEELGCLAIIIPILGIMAISVIEFFINLYYYSRKYYFGLERKIVFVISGIIGIFSLILFLFSLVN